MQRGGKVTELTEHCSVKMKVLLVGEFSEAIDYPLCRFYPKCCYVNNGNLN